MKILNLTLQNFKGIRYFDLDTQGKDANIYGDNATGKTTLADAFMWLLFDKDSSNRKDFEIKTLGPDGEPEHGLDHSVEAVLQLESGNHLALKKVYKEVWTKKRGSATAEFTGHTTDHFIDGVPVQKKVYDGRIAEIADENVFRLLTDPKYFNEILHWQKRRELLLQVCGDVSDEEVIARQKALSALKDILGNKTIEQQRKIIQARLNEINKELERIPVRIDEAERNLPDIDDKTDPVKLQAEIEDIRATLQAKQEELAQVRAGGLMAEKNRQIKEIESQIIDLRNKLRIALDEKVADSRADLQSVRYKMLQTRSKLESNTSSLKQKELYIKTYEEKLSKLRQIWHEENAKTFEFEQSDTCPACGQPLPKERLQEARDKALAEFNRNKAEKLESINEEGKRLKEEKLALEKDMETVRAEIKTAKLELSEFEKMEAEVKAYIDKAMQGAAPVESTPEYAELRKQIDAIRSEMSEIEIANRTTVLKLSSEIYELNNTIKSLEQVQARTESRKTGEKRIQELKDRERELAEEFEELERQLYLTEEFIRTKVRMLEDKINSKFKLARFKLFDVQVNGALAECCETTFNGVPYSNLNNGAKLNIGLDVINTMAEHYGFAPPVWLDNAESVTDILPTKGQQIRLIVSGADKKLRIEMAERELLREVD
ncbi:MAG: AAA family ATPase [Fastidiosipilaceae bacterium]|jgi:DNA repair exonuclease SbcCD ATPase subunit